MFPLRDILIKTASAASIWVKNKINTGPEQVQYRSRIGTIYRPSKGPAQTSYRSYTDTTQDQYRPSKGPEQIQYRSDMAQYRTSAGTAQA